MTKAQTLALEIGQQIDAAKLHLVAIEDRMRDLKALGVFPAVPRESWEHRNGTDKRYLYFYFPRGRSGGWLGPDGKKKMYVCSERDEDAIADARAKVARTVELRRLESNALQVKRWIRRAMWDLERLHKSTRKFPVANLPEVSQLVLFEKE